MLRFTDPPPQAIPQAVPAPTLQRLRRPRGTGARGEGRRGQYPCLPHPRTARQAGAPVETGIKTSDDAGYFPKLELPDPGELFRRDSEAAALRAHQLDARKRPGGVRVIFPEETPVSQDVYRGRSFPHMVELVEPGFVCHRRLLYEQPNFERQGWDFGVLQPGISLGIFWYDTLLLPYHTFSRPCQSYDCNAGKCLPGDPTPLYLYREPFSLTGFVAQAGTVIGGFFVFP